MTWNIDINSLHGKRALENAAVLAHEANRAYCEANGDRSQVPYGQAPQWQLDSVAAGVLQIFGNPDTTPEESHENWMRHKEKDGWAYGAEKNETLKTHPCMVPYDKLPEVQRHKDAIFGAVVRMALWIYERRTFQDKKTKMAAAEFPFKANENIKQTGLVLSIGRTNLLCFEAVRAYLQATGYPAHDYATNMGSDYNAQLMVLQCLSHDSVEAAYDAWRRAQWPTLHPEFPLAGDPSRGPSNYYLQLTRLSVQWYLIFGIAQAMLAIEGMAFAREREDWIQTHVWSRSWKKGGELETAIALAEKMTSVETAEAIDALAKAADSSP